MYTSACGEGSVIVPWTPGLTIAPMLPVLLGVLVGGAVAMFAKRRSRRSIVIWSSAFFLAGAGLVGLTTLLGQLGDGDQFDAPRERLTIRNDSGEPMYVLVPGSQSLDANQLADTKYFVNGVSVPDQSASVILRVGRWSDGNEACLDSEFLVVISRSGRRDYSHNVRDSTGRVVSPAIKAADLSIAFRQADGCWSEAGSFTSWDGEELRPANAPFSLPAFVWWAVGAAMALAFPLALRRRSQLAD